MLYSIQHVPSREFFPSWLGDSSLRGVSTSSAERSVHMRKCVSAMRVVVPVFLGLLLLPALVAAGPSAVNATGTLNYLGGSPGNQTYRFDYALENIDVQPALAGFIVFFDNDGGNRSDFVSYEAPAGWEDVFVVPEGPDGS